MASARGWSSIAQATSTSACNVAPAGPALLCHSSSSRALEREREREREREGGHNDITQPRLTNVCTALLGKGVTYNYTSRRSEICASNALYIRTALIGKGDDN